jgi:putative acetyltransferase
MIDKVHVRVATRDDIPAIKDLTSRAFGRPDEAAIIDALMKDEEVLIQFVAEVDNAIVGHVLFYPVGVFGRLGASGLGPMSVDPWVQREKIGTIMATHALQEIKKAGVPLVFVLGHPEYYPRFGFAQETTEPFESPLKEKGAAFMALRLRYGPPMSGRLIFPKAFGI